MNIPNLGKYAAVGDLTWTPQKLNYRRGYGNLVIHEVITHDNISTSVSKWDRVEPSRLPFGCENLPTPKNETYRQTCSESTIAWSDKPFFKV